MHWCSCMEQRRVGPLLVPKVEGWPMVVPIVNINLNRGSIGESSAC